MRARVGEVELRRRARRFVKGLPLGRKLWRFAWSLDEHGAYQAASSMAFDGFLSMIPLLSLWGWALHAIDRGEVILSPLFRALPGPASKLAEADLLRLSDRAVMALAPLGVLGFVWLSSNGVAAAMRVCERMFEAERRTWSARRLIAVGWVFAVIACIVGLTAIARALGHVVGHRPARVLFLVLSVPVLVALVVGFFRTAIRRPRGMRRRVLPGALLTVGFGVVVSFALGMSAGTLARYSFFYGSLAAVALLLVWLWMISLSLLVGGELNAQLEGVREFPPSTLLGSAAP